MNAAGAYLGGGAMARRLARRRAGVRHLLRKHARPWPAIWRGGSIARRLSHPASAALGALARNQPSALTTAAVSGDKRRRVHILALSA